MNRTKDPQDNTTNANVNKSKKDAVISFLALLLSGGMLVYWAMPTYMHYLDSTVTESTILKLEKSYLSYSYFNRYDSTDYELSREIDKREYDFLRGNDRVNVTYPKFFPTSVLIEGVDKKKSVVLPAIMHLLFLIALVKLIKDLFKK